MQNYRFMKKQQGRPKINPSEKRVLVATYITEKQKQSLKKKYGNVSNAVRTAILAQL